MIVNRNAIYEMTGCTDKGLKPDLRLGLLNITQLIVAVIARIIHEAINNPRL
jgi:hypothetical protein